MPPHSFVPPVSVTHQPPVKPLGKWQASKMIVKQSFAVLKQDKEILWFPVLSALVTMIAVVLVVVTIFPLISGLRGDVLTTNPDQGPDAATYAMLFVYYIVTFFILNFFNAGILTIVDARFRGENAHFGDGMRNAVRNMGKIFVFSVILATVGVILRILADRMKGIGRIVAGILGAAWSIMTYFSLPALIVGNTSIKGSFKESAAMIRKTWGEAIIVNFGMGLFFGLLVLVAFFACLVILILFPSLITLIIVGGVFLLFAIALSVVSASLNVIFKLALYEYARTGTVPIGFSPELIQSAVKVK